METNLSESEPFDEIQSIKVIREMIQVSRKKLKSDGILFIIWGWINFITYMLEYILQSVPHTFLMDQFKGKAIPILIIFGLLYTIFYVYRESRKATTYVGVSLRYVWISMFAGMVLINLIQFNVLHKIIFELQLPVFMVLTSFAIVVTGGILRYKIVIAGGIVFGLLAFVCSYLDLHQQLLVESIAWFVAFIIPGHALYAKRKI
jgi:hypothetical protein